VDAQQSFNFSREPKSVRAARGALDGLNGELPKARLYDASLCLSELVSNAIQHPGSGGEVELTLALDEERLRVEVADQGGGFDPQRASKDDDRGWGLFIVDSLSDRWGIDAGERTVVWFEILRAS
jgi:anti-sigma regulatory factor (Ser/Thr protein kinase)